MLAYNVIRLLMAQAACNANVDPRSLSFKHTVQLWTEWVVRGLCSTNDRQRLFTSIAQCKVGLRPGRIEPRMRKRRPKPYVRSTLSPALDNALAPVNSVLRFTGERPFSALMASAAVGFVLSTLLLPSRRRRR